MFGYNGGASMPAQSRRRPSERICPSGITRGIVVRCALCLACAFTLGAVTARANTISARDDIHVNIEPTGVYSITFQNPAWIFGGNIGRKLNQIAVHKATDRLGPYQEISFNYEEGGLRRGSIRTYRYHPVIVFAVQYFEHEPNAAPFPTLATYPQGLYHLTYNGQFGKFSFSAFGADSPWIFFDDRANTFILSPAQNFLVAHTARGANGEIITGIDPAMATLPGSFSHQTVLVVEKSIRRAFDTWGRALTALHRKARPANDADVVLAKLGYWTDNGAAYYYHFEPALGYEGTLLAVRDDFRKNGIPLGYMQLDSWFYPKGPEADWKSRERGIYRYVADPALFPEGLPAFQKKLGLPLITHARWIDAKSPYRRQYRISRNVAIDPRYWNHIAGYLFQAGVVTYEQDWLDANAQPTYNLTAGDAFFSEMANANAARKMTMQYCMPLPRHYLQSTHYDNVTTIRTSGDRFEPAKWDEFLYDSRLASAVGLWPWADVFMSSETHNLLLATLSAGPVGVGDPIGALDKANLMRVVRADGVIVKPDVSIAPLDEAFISDARNLQEPMIAAAYTNFAELHAAYVFAYNRGEKKPVTLTPESLGISRPAYVYDYFEGRGFVLGANGGLGQMGQNVGTWRAYYIVVPIGRSGIGFLGDAGQFVTLGKKRIANVSDNGALEVSVIFAEGETSRTLFGFAPAAPSVRALKGNVGKLAYDEAKHLFRLEASPDSDHTASVIFSTR